jgi:hypothetical protein
MAPLRLTDRALLKETQKTLATLLPVDWKLTGEKSDGRDRADISATIVAPDGTKSYVFVEVKRVVVPRDLGGVVTRLRTFAANIGFEAVLLVAALYLSESTRESLEAQGIGFIDSTGNVLIRSARPGLYVRLQGASRDPFPSDQSLRTLKGRGTGRALRALLDFVPPFSLRELASRADVPVGSLSRVVDLLDREALIQRTPRGPITAVDWQRVVRRWAKDYAITTNNTVGSFLDPRGINSVTSKLQNVEAGYAATGSFGAQRFEPVAPTRIAAIYVDDPGAWANKLGLRQTDVGANVWLIEPYDRVVFERTTTRDGIMCVNPTQLAVDLLTGPGRDPSEGEELLRWMEGNTNVWRT